MVAGTLAVGGAAVGIAAAAAASSSWWWTAPRPRRRCRRRLHRQRVCRRPSRPGSLWVSASWSVPPCWERAAGDPVHHRRRNL